jgi:hypothetical protein
MVQRLAVSQGWVAVEYDGEIHLIDTASGKFKHGLKTVSWPYEQKAVFDQSLVF